MAFTKIYYCADVHGSESCFSKFLKSPTFYQTDIAILSGDLTGKRIVPMIEQPDGSYVTEFLDIRTVTRSREERENLEKRIGDNGFYFFHTNPREEEEVRANQKFRDELFTRLISERMERWIKRADEEATASGIKYIMMPGNDDDYVVDRVFERATMVINPDGKVVDIDDKHEMISMGASNKTPWNSPREYTEEELTVKIENLVAKLRNVSTAIFNLHVPPYNSRIDEAPLLDKKMGLKAGMGGLQTGPAGSKAVRASIEKYQPLMGLHGHIHESRGVTNIGKTRCFNPGSEYGESILRGLVIAIDANKVKGYQFTSG